MQALPGVFLGLGSNLGDREAMLGLARAGLEARGFRTTLQSSLYETEPVGGPAQGWYLNQVLGGATALPPRELLSACLALERELGRSRGIRYGPRRLDIDLLLYGEFVMEGPELVLPHPRLHERRFVLVPLAEIAPALRHPRLGLTLAELRERCADPSRVRLHRAQGTPA